MSDFRKEERAVHYGSGTSYYLRLKSEVLPFALFDHKFKEIEHSNQVLQKFVRLIEKKFDSIWYIGADFFGNDIYERFMFHHGGFMEISLKGEIRCFFVEDKTEKMKNAILYATEKLSHKGSASHLKKEIKIGQKLISLRDSIRGL